MKLNYHNVIQLQVGKNIYKFYNTMLNSVYEKIANFESFFDKIIIGNGKTENLSTNYKLSNIISIINLETETIQNNINRGDLYTKKFAKIKTSDINSKYITEAGITSSDTSETIYNYFSFVNDDHPNGISLEGEETIIIEITIFLNITANSDGLLTAGNNPFVSFLLGEGTNSNEFYVARGEDLSANIFIDRNNNYSGNKEICTISKSFDNGVGFIIEGDLSNGATKEIVFLLGDSIFARINTDILQRTHNSTESITSEKNCIVNLGENVSSVESVYNETEAKNETNYFIVDYATNFSSKIILPFNNLFDIDTPRFLSKDGDKLFFVLNDIVYMFKNEIFQIKQIFAKNLHIQNIYKIVSFDNFIFIFSKDKPNIRAYILDNNNLIECTFDLSAFEYNTNIEQFIDIDIVQGKNGVFMLGFYAPISGATAYTLYFTFDDTTKNFIYSSYVSSVQTTFNYLLAFHKNNFSDAQMLYLMNGESASKCKRALHSLSGTVTTSYNVTTYYYTYQTASVYVKSRAVVVEKNIEPNLWLYYYPQIYRYALPALEEAEKTYISTNLLYIIQRMADKTYRAYNIVGYYTIEEFSNGMPNDLDQSKILSIEFLNDTVLFFMDDENEPIVAYNLKLDKTCIENVSSQNGTYTINLTRKHTLGGNNEGVIATLAININI